MNLLGFESYRSPDTHETFAVENDALVAADGQRFPIGADGIPDLLWPPSLGAVESRWQRYYDDTAEQIYDAALDWQFAALHEDEDAVREQMVDMLHLEPGFRVLEVGCGTGRDSHRLARKLGADGELFLQDLSPNMVRACARRMAEQDRGLSFPCRLSFAIANACYLPFPDGHFDAVFHFGGFNEFSDQRRAAAEFARVAKPSGLVLFGDESVGPWLRAAEFGRIVIANNPLFAHTLPLEALPLCARDVTLRWMMGNCFYVITFRKGDGPPPLDLDLPHQGWRGGTMRSRYFGVLEGVTPEAKELARQGAAAAGVSIHEWLDRLVRRQAAVDIRASEGSKS